MLIKRPDIIRRLLDMGADPLLKEVYELTPYEYAVRTHYDEGKEILEPYNPPPEENPEQKEEPPKDE